jgi:hypothetical protein
LAPSARVEAIHYRPWEETRVPPESSLAHAIVGLSPTTIIATPSPAATTGTPIKDLQTEGLTR